MKTKPFLLAATLILGAAYTATSQPAIVTQPQDQTNVLGTTATFSVGATGTASLSYQWGFGNPSTNLDGAIDSNLVLSNVQVSNQGPYEVVITNIEGAVTSVVANLYVVAPPTLQFVSNIYTVAESAGSLLLNVRRTGWLASTISVDFASADGSATNGSKYTAVSGTLVFGPYETNKTIVVPILNEGFVEGRKSFTVRLSNPGGGAALGLTIAIVTITDNDIGIQFELDTYLVKEDAGSVVLGIVRGDDGTLPVTVNLATANSSAVNGLDYTGTSQTLSFAPQERLKLVTIPILNNALKQPSRGFTATLANPAGVSLGALMTTWVLIVDNDQGFQFEQANYSVAEDAGVVRVAVLRGTDDTNSSVTVDYATIDLTATSGVDYSGTTNSLSFGPGDRIKLVTIPILNDGLKKPNKIFRVMLANPTGGAVLASSPTSANVSIINSNPGAGFELSSYSVWENAGAINVTVLRGNAAALGPITIDYATGDSTAKAGQDYQAISGTLAFQQNERVKTITIPILRDVLVTNNTSFTITLSSPTGGATLGAATTTVNILDATGLRPYWAAPPFDTALTIRREGLLNLITWSGGGQLQRADNPAGAWQTLTSATNPYAVQSPILASFYRVTRPRPVKVYLPSSYDSQTPVPLLILLHGHGGPSGGGDFVESYMKLLPLAEARGFLYCHPDGTVDQAGDQFWNATDGCCDFFNSGTDDAGYLRAVIEEIGRQFAVDRKRIYLIGWSNGAFMAYRMACQSADLIAGIASLAGATFLDPSRCAPSQPVNILHIHGTADPGVPYAGGANIIIPGLLPGNMPAFPGAVQTVRIWAGYNGARDPVTDPGPSMDLDLNVPGVDTVITRYTNHPPGGAVELWTVDGATHFPTLSPEFAPKVIDWLLAHPKP